MSEKDKIEIHQFLYIQRTAETLRTLRYKTLFCLELQQSSQNPGAVTYGMIWPFHSGMEGRDICTQVGYQSFSLDF